MAEQDGEEKTEEPTPRKIEKSIKDGQVLTSKEAMMTVVLLVGAMCMYYMGDWIFGALVDMFRYGFNIGDKMAGSVPLYMHFADMIQRGLYVVILFAGPMILFIFATQYVIGGLHFVQKKLKPKLSNMSPIKGFGRMFGPNALFELFKSLLKVTFIATIAWLYMETQLDIIVRMSDATFADVVAFASDNIMLMFIILVGSMGIVSAFDVLYQSKKHHDKLKMTKKEVKDEHKESDGNPEVKAKIRQKMREILEGGGGLGDVPKANAVVTNPSHFAVALFYDPDDPMAAPKVVAKGTDDMARRIREIAKENDVPILRYPLLARALYYSSKVGDEIHHELYKAVATILAYVFNEEMLATGEQPSVDVPKSMQVDEDGKSLERQA